MNVGPVRSFSTITRAADDALGRKRSGNVLVVEVVVVSGEKTFES